MDFGGHSDVQNIRLLITLATKLVIKHTAVMVIQELHVHNLYVAAPHYAKMAVHVLHLVNVPVHLDLLDPIAQISTNARQEHTIVISYVQIHMGRLHVLVC